MGTVTPSINPATGQPWTQSDYAAFLAQNEAATGASTPATKITPNIVDLRGDKNSSVAQNAHAGQAAQGGALYYPDGTVALPGQEQQALTETTDAASGSNLHTFLSGAGSMLADVGALGALVVAPELGATIGGAGGAAAAGALSGAASTGLRDSVTGAPLTLGSVGKGAALGAVSGAAGYAASPLTSSLASNTGINPAVASGIVKGGIGAGLGALGSAVSGGNIANGAITGGVAGGVNGLVGGATGSSQLGGASGTIAGSLAGRYLTSPTTPAAPSPAAASTPAAAPAKATVAQSAPATATPTASTAAPTNIGPYNNFSSAGLGFQPRVQVNPGITDYNTYGQGPQASFFAPASGT
jgi:hypothetical protein